MGHAVAAEIAVAAAKLVVDDGLDFHAAKRRAARDLDVSPRESDLPSNEAVEAEVRARNELFHADTQPGELAVLRELAATWMTRLAAFRPHLAGAVWRGTANRLSSIRIELYCDDPKSAELALIGARVDYEVATTTSPRGRAIDVLTLEVPCPELGRRVPITLSVLDWDDLRGALRADARGRSQRGDLDALRALAAGGAAS